MRAEYAVCTQAIRSVHWIGAQQLLAFTCEELTDAKAGFFKNRVYAIDTRDGDAREIRLASTGAEATFIRSIHVSYSQRFFIILLKDKPFELWDVKTLLKLRSVKSNVQVTAIGWCPVLNKKKHFTTIQTEERFVLTAPGGQFHYYSIENNVITKTQVRCVSRTTRVLAHSLTHSLVHHDASLRSTPIRMWESLAAWRGRAHTW